MPGAAGAEAAKVSHLLFADDLTLLALSEECMARLLDALAAFCVDKGMTVNVAKTKAVVFSASTRPALAPCFKFMVEEIEVVPEFTFLGLSFAARMTFPRMAQRWEGPLRGGCAKAYALAKDRNVHHNPHVMLVLLQTFGFPCMMYGCQVWGAAYLSESLTFTAVVLAARASTFGNMCVLSPNPLVQLAVRGEVALVSGGKKQSWLAKVHSALSTLPGLRAEFVSREGRPQSVAVNAVEQAWCRRWDAQWADVIGEPRDEEVAGRSLVVYKSHFRRRVAPSAFARPQYLSSTDVPWRAVRALAQLRLGAHPLRSVLAARGPNPMPYSERVCQRCSAAWPGCGVDDEYHLLFECECTQPVRDCRAQFLASLSDWTVRGLVCHPALKSTAAFVHDCLCRARLHAP